MMNLQLAAVIFDADQPVDALMGAGLEGLPASGWLQVRLGPEDCDCPDFALRSLGDGQIRAISQDLGTDAQGCRLDGGALADVAGELMGLLDQGPRLLVLNRFGKTEAEGGACARSWKAPCRATSRSCWRSTAVIWTCGATMRRIWRSICHAMPPRSGPGPWPRWTGPDACP